MTADTITTVRLDDLAAALDAACNAVDRLVIDVYRGAISPTEAAAIVNETIDYLNKTAE